jgi:hypothetical protein
MTRTALYRHYGIDGSLLYVGISLGPVRRLEQHKHKSDWFRTIARIDVQWLPSRSAALDAEARAIANENPRHNKSRPAVPGQQLLEQPAPRSTYAKAIRHDRTGRLNGWWFEPGEAEELIGWFRVVFPKDRFSLVDPSANGNNYIPFDLELKSHRSEEWAASAPDHAAGDAYDERMRSRYAGSAK